MISRADTTGSNKVDFEEFYTIMNKKVCVVRVYVCARVFVLVLYTFVHFFIHYALCNAYGMYRIRSCVHRWYSPRNDTVPLRLLLLPRLLPIIATIKLHSPNPMRVCVCVCVCTYTNLLIFPLIVIIIIIIIIPTTTTNKQTNTNTHMYVPN